MARLSILPLTVVLLVLAGLSQPLRGQSTYYSDVPLGLDWIVVPEDNPITSAKVELGRQLFFDPRLSATGKVSCASCHNPDKGWGDDRPFTPGVHGELTTRNVPSVISVGLHRTLFWDGRSGSLEDQALVPLQNPAEMDMPLEELERRLSEIKGYRTQFEAIFPEGVSAENAAKSLAAFQRTLLAGQTAYDRFRNGRADALDGEIGRGNGLFFGKANCGNCHVAKVLTDHQFHNIGTGLKEGQPQDRGLALQTGREEDAGKFRTPFLRDLARTAPYFHDGSKATLEEVVDFYNEGGGKNANLDPRIVPLNLTPEEKKALVTFLREGLRSEVYPDVPPPTLPE